jgi:hypothetical protein
VRGGPVIIADSGGHHLNPFQLVIVALAQGETKATVVIGTGQIAANTGAATAQGRIVRVLSPEEIAALQLREETDADARSNLRVAGLPASGSDWLIAPGAEPAVFAHPTLGDTHGSARSFINRLFGTSSGEAKKPASGGG